MSSFNEQTIIDFLEPVHLFELSQDEGFKKSQIGYYIDSYEDNFPDLSEADLIILGIGEYRGKGFPNRGTPSADNFRTEFYQLYQWHKGVKIADIGNIIIGKNIADSYAALKIVLSELLLLEKAKILIIGGSHDLTTAQCDAYAQLDRTFDLCCIDAKMDMDAEAPAPADRFLLDMFTKTPNYLNHYNHLAFQSYFVHPEMLEVIDRLRFDCVRVGRVKEKIEEVEPPIRNSDIISLDISCIESGHAPANLMTPNGLSGEEACRLMQFAGMSSKVSSIGLYNYQQHLDRNSQTAKQLSHLAWYLVDGLQQGKQEADPTTKQNFNEFHLAFAEMETTFLQSKKTGRWWMTLPDGQLLPCSYTDYILATQNEIPERWLRAIERS
ncbi:formimidoylglutamase [Arachidicoccus ginsenosidivorans]|jgi:arginase family enzyme|uniref:Arginase n=1 Tax=Arachidicoccus ginsenosidivorans TaxID=496057 RepID=A0A5B8VID8_9BACT|nr:arginase family protein [Arachidicoccus ginsenosidivorans]QEC70765.1 arginase [Arachidicoccus ginsenosidivorans]